MMSTVPVIPKHEQPDWMRRALRGTDWGVLLALLIGLATSWPFLAFTGFSLHTGNESAVYRTWETAEALREGRLYPRWSAYSAKGYGAPIPEFLPPGPSYSAAIIHILITDDPTTAVRLLYIIFMCTASVGMYSFVMKQSNATAGLLASLLYVTSPYIAFTVPHALGDFSAMAGLAILPTLLWAVIHLYKQNAPLDPLLIILLSAGLLLAEPRYTVFVPLMVLTISFGVPPQRIFMTIISLIIGVLLASFYWLPAIFEQHYIQWITQAGQIHIPPITLKTLISPFIQADPGMISPTPQMTLGWAIIFCNVLALASRKIQSSENTHRRFQLLGLLTTCMALIWLPNESWLLGPISLSFAIGGTGILTWRQGLLLRQQRLLYGATLLVVLLLAMPIFFIASPISAITDVNAQSIYQFERQDYGFATVPPWQEVPIAHNPTLIPNPALESGYLVGDLNRFSHRDNRRLQSVTTLLLDDTHHQTYQIRNIAAQRLQLQQTYFPGWEATLDDDPITLERNPETGLTQLVMPEVRTTSVLNIYFSPTSLRLFAWAVTTIALLITLMMLRARTRYAGRQLYYDDVLLNQGDSRIAGFVILAFLGMVILSNAPDTLIPLQASPNYTLQGAIRMDNRTDSGLEAVAARLSASTITSGDSLEVTTFWQTNRFLTSNYQRRLTLRDVTTGNLHWQSPFEPLSNIPTRRWVRGRTVMDEISISIPQNIADGRYTLSIEIQPCNNGACDPTSSLTFFDRVGNVVGSQLTIPQVITVSDAPNS